MSTTEEGGFNKFTDVDTEEQNYHPFIKRLKTEAFSNIFTAVIIVTILLVLIVSTTAYFIFYRPSYQNKMIRGVNLGGWFVLEPWITPSLFENQTTNLIVDEYTFCQQNGASKAKELLEKHWDTWISEKEIKEVASYGINYVRIPVGYWLFDVEPSEPFVQGSLFYLKRALTWIKAAKLKAILDLHGAPGSQNGFDNSGRAGVKNWTCCSGKNIERTINVLKNITMTFSTLEYHSVVEGINLINEPFGVDSQTLQDFYRNAYKAVTGVSQNPNLIISISDGFQNFESWKDFKQSIDGRNLFLDTHIYHIFDYRLLNYTYDQHISLSCEYHKNYILNSSKIMDTIVGEFSLARTDCTKWLNGHNKGSRFDGTLENTTPIGSCAFENDHLNWSSEYKMWLKKYFEMQIESYEAGSGWFFWNIKTENSPHWDYLTGVRQGWIPKDLSSRTYGCFQQKI